MEITSENKKQLVEFYKAIKVAAGMVPGNNPSTNKVVQFADQIIAELKKDNPDNERIQNLTDQLQALASH